MATGNKVREQLTQKFLAALNQGRIPWEACWSQGRPENAVTGKTYRGVNAIALSYAADERGYADPRWCTYNQAQQNGWQVKKGETSATAVEYWAFYDLKEKKLLSWQEMHDKLKADPDYEKHLQLRCRIYPVFNAQQIDGIPALEERRQTDIGILRQQRDALIRNMGIRYEEYGNRAFYSPSMDRVVLPPEASFDDTYSYMATFLHECGHATGHPDRLNRDLSGFKGSESYAREELRAEIASAFTAQSLGLQLTPSQLEHHTRLHAAYIQSWAGILKDAPDELFRAIKAAEEISDYLIEKGEFNMEHKSTPQLFKSETVQQRKIMEWLVEQGITNNDITAAQLTSPAMVRVTNPAGQYMDVYCSQDSTVRILDVTEEREADLLQLFWNETNDPETQGWREELTADEAAMVEQWDTQTASGFSKLASDILEQSAPAEQILVAIESTDDYTDANFHAELHDMEKQNPDGSYGTPVNYYRIVKIGDSGRIEVLDKNLVFPTKVQAQAAAESIPYAQLVDYDTLVHEAGKNLTAKYTLEEIPDSPDLRLRFHGYGKIQDYSSVEARPWQAQISRIREITVDNGITEIGRNVLNDYPAVEEITWPASITHSDPHALWNCPNLKGISLPGGAQGRVSASGLHSPRAIMELAEKYPGLKIEQYEEISAGLQQGLAADQVDMYAKPEFTSAQMNAIRYCLSDGLTADQLQLIVNPAFDPIQIDIIRSGFKYGMTLEEVTQYARPEIPAREMLDAYWSIRNNSSAPDLMDENLSQGKEAPETMTVVMVEPSRQARIIELPHTLEAMQQTVGGSIEAAYPFEDPVAIICNEEGKLNGLPLNRALYGEGGDVYDVLCGTFFVTGVGTEDFCSLSPDLAQKYLERFKSPEQFFRINGHIVALKTEQENIGQVLDDYLTGQSVSQGSEPAPVAEAPTLNMGG